jgi:phosphoribosylformylglycinamidine synthase
VARVPLREPGMEPFEIMVSESQERMLCVVEPARVDEVLAVCAQWETLATVIGSVTDGDALRVLSEGTVVGELPVSVLVDECPLYDLEPAPASAVDLYPAPEAVLTGDEDPGEVLLALLASANLASRRPVFEQYDPVVQSRTVRRPDEADAAVLMLPDGSAIAVSIDGNGRRVACDPRAGAAEAVYECAANLACVGAEPRGLTNCLNFGNPEKPHVAWQLVEAVEGLASACEALGVPVVGGNVSLYNEAPTGPIYPTPVVGMVGKLPSAAAAAGSGIGFVNAGDAIALVGPFQPSLAGSELAKLRGHPLAGPLPPADVGAVRAAHDLVREAVRAGRVASAHDVSEGGLAVALAECCLAGALGARVSVEGGLEELFGEAPGRAFIVSGAEEDLTGLGVIIGRVGGDALEIAGLRSLPLAALREARDRGLAQWL